MNYKLSPSELTYLFEGCKYCFNLKVKHSIDQPSMPMPGIFSAIAGRQKEFYAGKRTEEFCRELPPGVVEFGEKWVESLVIKADNSPNTCFIRGRFDFVIKFDDGTFGVIDCKTARSSESKTKMYGRQLQAYTYALENAAEGKLNLSPITKLGLLYFEPIGFKQIENAKQAFEGNLLWQEVKRDDKTFLTFINSVVKTLDSNDVQPQVCDNCEYCRSGKKCLAGKKEASEKGCTCCLWCTHRSKMKDIKNIATPLPEDNPFCPTCNSPMNRKSGKYGQFWSCQKYPDCKGTRKIGAQQ
ncbi:MAG: PD-(D/E)XK nuclease family protein [Planctomycetota bacterium]